jgi:hypothetical protein
LSLQRRWEAPLSHAHALSLGPVSHAGRLGQPLDFAVTVRLDADESVAPTCIAADVAVGDTPVPPQHVRARLVRNPRSNDAEARVYTTVKLTEPVVSVTLSLGCPPKISHKFVSLLDPPAATARSPVLAAAPPDERAGLIATAAAAEMPAASEPAAPPRPPEVPPGLEERLERLHQDQLATQQSLQALQQRLRNAEQAARQTDPAIYGLATLVVLLMGVIVMLLWRLMLMQRQAAWRRSRRRWSTRARCCRRCR